MLPLLEKEIIEVHNWLTYMDFIDILAVSEMTPGPIAINSATFIGYKVAGVMGSAIATFGVVLPSFIIMSAIFYFLSRFKDSEYIGWAFEGIRPVVFGLMSAGAISVSKNTFIDLKAVFISALILFLLTVKKLHPIKAIILAGILGVILY